MIPATAIRCFCPPERRFVHSDCLQAFLHALFNLLRRNTEVLRTECHIILDYGCNDLIVRVLKHHAGGFSDVKKPVIVRRIHSEHNDTSSGRQQKRVDMLCKRRLAGAVMTENRNELASLDIKAHVVNGTLFSDSVSVLVPSDVLMD